MSQDAYATEKYGDSVPTPAQTPAPVYTQPYPPQQQQQYGQFPPQQPQPVYAQLPPQQQQPGQYYPPQPYTENYGKTEPVGAPVGIVQPIADPAVPAAPAAAATADPGYITIGGNRWQKKWFILTICLVVGFVVILAVGLGVGLGLKKKKKPSSPYSDLYPNLDPSTFDPSSYYNPTTYDPSTYDPSSYVVTAFHVP